MPRTLLAPMFALFGCATVLAVGCRRSPAIPDPPALSGSPAASAAAEIGPDTPVRVEQVLRLLAYTAAQRLPVPTVFQSVPTVSVPTVRSAALTPADAWTLWTFFHAREAESRLVPLLVPAHEAQDEGAPDERALAASASGVRDTIAALEKREAGEFFRLRELERRTQEHRINESLARARAGTPQSDLDKSFVAMCKQDPAQCTPHSELDAQRAALDAAGLVAVPRSPAQLPGWSFLREVPGVPGAKRSLQLWLFETSPWLVPLVLEFGGWNDCPADADHAVVWREWHTRFGASIVYLDADTLEAWVERPPSTTLQRKQLAWEQYLYCEDIVSQGAGSVSALANELAGQTWFFWWD